MAHYWVETKAVWWAVDSVALKVDYSVECLVVSMVVSLAEWLVDLTAGHLVEKLVGLLAQRKAV